PTPHRYTPSLHDALPIYLPSSPNMDERMRRTDALILAVFVTALAPAVAFASDAAAGKAIAAKWCAECHLVAADQGRAPTVGPALDRKSTRLNSSHVKISY